MWDEIQKYNDLLEKAVTEMKSRSKKLAEAEYHYRMALSKRLTELRAEGQAVTHLADIARGEPKIAKLRLDRDIAKGVYDSSQEAINMYKIRIRVLENQYAREWRCYKMSKSIMQRNKECIVCHNSNVEEHHVFFGTANRKLSEKYGLKVYLCTEHHRGTRGVHGKYGKTLDTYLKQLAQTKFEEKNCRDTFIQIFGKSYL